MEKIPLLKPREVIRIFEKFGWKVSRQKGSHVILTKTGHIATLSIPKHSEVARGTLRKLISAAGLTIDDFLKNYKNKI